MLSCDREKEPKTIGPARLLRARRDRPRGCRAADKRDEIAPPHVLPLSGGNCTIPHPL
jgi:hypothetical protein